MDAIHKQTIEIGNGLANALRQYPDLAADVGLYAWVWRWNQHIRDINEAEKRRSSDWEAIKRLKLPPLPEPERNP